MAPHIAGTYRWRGPGGRLRVVFIYTNGTVELIAVGLHWYMVTTPPAPAWRPSTWTAMRRQLTTP